MFMFPLTTIVWDHLNAKKHLCNDKYIFMEKAFPHGKIKSQQRPPLYHRGMTLHSKVGTATAFFIAKTFQVVTGEM